MLPTFAYYLASPFSLLAFFFDGAHVPELLLTMTVLKVACMAGTYVVFAHKALGDLSPRPIFFALCYALSGYVVCYASNIMWLDALILLPLILVSVTKLARGEGRWHLVLLLVILFFTQFYIAYMVGIFTFLWLLGALVRYRAPHKLRKIGTLIGCAVLAAGCCAVTLLPTALRLLQNAGFVDAAPAPVWLFSHDLHTLFSRAFFGVYDTLMGKPGSMPVLYCGTICLLLLPAYCTNRGIPLRERLLVLGGSAFLLLSMALPPLTFAWHAFDEAAWFQFRYSFLLIFLWVFAANRCVQHYKTVRRWVFGLTGLLLAGYFALCWPLELQGTFYYMGRTIVLLLLAWTALGLLCTFLKGRARMVLSVLLLLGLVVELTANAYVNLNSLLQEVPFTAAETYREEFAQNTRLLSELPEGEDGPYRVEHLDQDLPNSGIAYGMMGQQFYSTAAQRALTLSLHSIGFYSRGIYQSNAGGTIASDSLLGIKYLFSEESPNDYYHPETSVDHLTAYENDFLFPLAFLASDQALGVTLPQRELGYKYYSYYFEATDSFHDLNRMFQALSGDETLQLFVPLPLDEFTAEGLEVLPQEDGAVVLRATGEGTPLLHYNLTAEMDAPVYGMFRAVHEVDGIVVELDGHTLHEPLSSAGAMIIYIGQFAPGDSIPLSLYLSGQEVYLDGQWLYALDTDLLWDLGGEFYVTAMENVSWESTRISGTVHAEEGQILFLSVPYDGGWRATVDGKEIPVEPALEAFLGVPVEPGQHEVVLTYRPVGFMPGLILSVLSLVLCLGLYFVERRRGKAGV